jgi:hypothetical protein
MSLTQSNNKHDFNIIVKVLYFSTSFRSILIYDKENTNILFFKDMKRFAKLAYIIPLFCVMILNQQSKYIYTCFHINFLWIRSLWCQRYLSWHKYHDYFDINGLIVIVVKNKINYLINHSIFNIFRFHIIYFNNNELMKI